MSLVVNYVQKILEKNFGHILEEKKQEDSRNISNARMVDLGGLGYEEGDDEEIAFVSSNNARMFDVGGSKKKNAPKK